VDDRFLGQQGDLLEDAGEAIDFLRLALQFAIDANAILGRKVLRGNSG
jgi:hypothetical protein